MCGARTGFASAIPSKPNRCNARGSSRGNCGPSRGNCGPPRADVSARQPASSGCGYYAMSGETMDLEQKQREDARWRILRVLDAGRPIPVSENIVWRVLHDIRL